MAESASWFEPAWPAPPVVAALATTRGAGGVGPYASFNLADHVGDDPARVAAHRERLAGAIGLGVVPMWLTQVHGTAVVSAADWRPGCEADASWSDRPGRACVVLTADCLPVLLADRDGAAVAAVHAGWRGLAAGVIEAAVGAMPVPAGRLIAWLGPAIGVARYEVGEEVRAAFVDVDPGAAVAFTSRCGGHWHADLNVLARRRLAALGITAAHGGDRCTHAEPSSFYSYRRDGTSGRMASLVWLRPR